MWVVLAYKPGVVVPVVIGPFREEVRADEWAQRIRDGYPDLNAVVEWVYAIAHRELLKDALADLQDAEPKVFSLD